MTEEGVGKCGSGSGVVIVVVVVVVVAAAAAARLEGNEMMGREVRGLGEWEVGCGDVEGLNSSKVVIRHGSEEGSEVDLGLELPARSLKEGVAGRANPTWCSAELFAE